MRYGICTGVDHLELLERAGYDYIELGAAGTAELTPERLADYRDRLKASRVKCEAFNGLYPGTMRLLDGSTDGEELRKYLHKVFGIVQSFGASVVVFGSGKPRMRPENMPYGEAYRRLVEVYRATGEAAAEYGLTIAIEPLRAEETDMINSMTEGAMLEADVALPNVKLSSDYFHVVAGGEEIGAIEAIRNFAHIHIATGKDRRYPLSGEGEKFDEFFRALKTVGYDGRVSIEGGTDNMEEDAPKALAFLKELEGRIWREK